MNNKKIIIEDDLYNSLGIASVSQFNSNTSDISQFKPDQSTLEIKETIE